MALLNLDKIVLNRTVLGPRCPVCGNELVETQPSETKKSRQWFAFWRTANSSARYLCKGCGKRYWLIEKKSKS